MGTYIWAPDSSRLYFAADDKGTSPIHSIGFGTESIGDKGYDITVHQTNIKIDAFLPGFNDNVVLARGPRPVLLFTRMSIQSPSEIYAVPLNLLTLPKCGGMGGGDVCADGEVAQSLTHLNDAVLSQISMSPLETFWFTGANNDKVEGFLVKPPNFDATRKYPVKFLIHGGPEGAWGDDWSYRWNPELFAAPTSSGPGYLVIMINFHGSTGYGQKFIDAINGDWGGAPYEDLMKGLDYAEKAYPLSLIHI